MKDFSNYSFESLVMDEDFQQWVKLPEIDFNKKMEEIFRGHPARELMAGEARRFLLSFNYSEQMPSAEKALMWQGIHKAMKSRRNGKVIVMRQFQKSFYSLPRIVAAALVLIVAGATVLYFQLTPSLRKIETVYGEIKAVTLPDGSVVTMNAHSAIDYYQDWNAVKEREIWFDGEAYFSVKHTMSDQPFIVHTPELDIEVLGTEFNVMKRNGKIKVALSSGKVKLRLKEEGSLTTPIYMTPGDMVEYAAETRAVKKLTVNPADYSAWKDHKLILDDTPVEEIIQTLKNIYNWQFMVTDASILEEKLTGEIETNDEIELLNALSKALNMDIRKNGNKITITRN